jgi:hypothetical protein
MMFSVADQPGADAVLRRIVARRPRWKAEAQAALALGEQGGSFPEKLANPGFEPIDKAQAGEKGAPPGWSVWFRPGTSGETRWTAEAARSGSRGLVVRGAEAGGPLQAVAVQPGEAYVASIFIRGRISSRAHGELVVQWRDETGGWLTTAARIATPVPAGGTDGWKRLALYAPVPRNAAALVLGVFLFDQQVGDSLQIDDASLRKVSQEK